MVIITMISPGSAVILSLYLCYLLLFIVEVVGLSHLGFKLGLEYMYRTVDRD